MECLNCSGRLKMVWKYCPHCGFEIAFKSKLRLVTEDESNSSESASASSLYSDGVRAQVFEVIVRQAIAGAPWREICAGPMQVNNISEKEVEAEMRRREGGSRHIDEKDFAKLSAIDSGEQDNLIEMNFKPTSKRLRDSFSSISNISKGEMFESRKALVKQKRVLTDLSELIEIIEKLENEEMKGD